MQISAPPHAAAHCTQATLHTLAIIAHKPLLEATRHAPAAGLCASTFDQAAALHSCLSPTSKSERHIQGNTPCTPKANSLRPIQFLRLGHKCSTCPACIIVHEPHTKHSATQLTLAKRSVPDPRQKVRITILLPTLAQQSPFLGQHTSAHKCIHTFMHMQTHTFTHAHTCSQVHALMSLTGRTGPPELPGAAAGRGARPPTRLPHGLRPQCQVVQAALPQGFSG